MLARTFWKAITMDGADLLEQFIGVLRRLGIRYCIVGGQGVNAYVEPLVSLDLDLVVAPEQLTELERHLRKDFTVEYFLTACTCLGRARICAYRCRPTRAMHRSSIDRPIVKS